MQIMLWYSGVENHYICDIVFFIVETVTPIYHDLQ